MYARLRICLEIFILLILWLLVISICLLLLPLILLVVIIRQSEALIYRFHFGMFAFRSEEILWTLDSPKNRYIINGIITVKGKLHIDQLREKVKSTVFACDENGDEIHPRMKSYIHSGYINYYWFKEKHTLDITDHVIQLCKNPIETEADLQQLIGCKCSEDLSGHSKPPWRIYLIPYFSNNEHKTVLFFRLSHALADGSSLAHFLIHEFADGKITNTQTAKKFSEKHRILMRLNGILYLPLVYLKMLLRSRDNHLLHGDSVIGEKHITWSKPVDLKLIKLAKNKLNLTVSEFLLACFTLALNRYFQNNGTKPPKEFLTLIPIDTRSSANQANEFDNCLSTLVFRLPTGRKELVRTIKDTHNAAEAFKRSGEVFSIDIGWKVASYFLPQVLSKWLVYFIVGKTSSITSFMIFPQDNMNILGHQVDMVTFWPPQTYTQGLGVSFCSYADTIRLGLESDHNVLKVPSELVNDFEEVCKNLINLSWFYDKIS